MGAVLDQDRRTKTINSDIKALAEHDPAAAADAFYRAMDGGASRIRTARTGTLCPQMLRHSGRALQFCVIDSNAALTAKGALTVRPIAGTSGTARPRMPDGEPNRYEPHVDACSPYSRTNEAAVLSGFAPSALADVLAHPRGLPPLLTD